MSALTRHATNPGRSAPEAAEHGLRLLWELRRDPLSLLSRLNREFGPVVRMRVPRVPLYLVSDPDAIQEAFIRTHRGYGKGLLPRHPDDPPVQPLTKALGQGLLTSGANLHRRQRRLIQPMFHRERIDGYAASFVELAGAAVDRWRDGDLRDVQHDMGELTLAIVARTVFDVDLDTAVAQTIRRSLVENQVTLRRSTSLWGRALGRLPVPSTRRWNASERETNAMIYGMIADRRAAGLHGTDLLSLLLSARDEDTGEPMPDVQVRDEALTLLLAGHETTANALSWALHLLANHPEEQERARAGGLPYTTAVVHETLRLYPPAWAIVRHLTEPRTVAGYPLPAGAALLLAPWVVHRDPRWWPEPQRFRPERWLEAGVPPHRYAYFPFGGGPRQCIGNEFALTEATLVLATLLRNWRVAAPLGTPPVRPLPLVTLRPESGVWLTVRRA